jgi:hypothetical protein
MRNVLHALLAAILLALTAFSFDSLAGVSKTYIGAGKTFMLGGNQRAALTVEGRNIGPSTVSALLSADGRQTPIAEIAPGKAFSLELPPGNTALFRNDSKRTATLRIELTNAVSRLSMGYENGDDGL